MIARNVSNTLQVMKHVQYVSKYAPSINEVMLKSIGFFSTKNDRRNSKFNICENLTTILIPVVSFSECESDDPILSNTLSVLSSRHSSNAFQYHMQYFCNISLLSLCKNERPKTSRLLTISMKSLIDMIQSASRGQTMTKTELIKALSNEAGLTKSKAKAVVKVFFDEISNTLTNNDRAEIRGLCSFFVKRYKGYSGKNPKTGEPIKVKPKKLPFFKCGKELKEMVDAHK